jgi:hypothetical protein
LVLLPAVNGLGMLLHNGAALLLPGWTHIGTGRPGGVEALGQNMLVLIACGVAGGGADSPCRGWSRHLLLLERPLDTTRPSAAAAALLDWPPSREW